MTAQSPETTISADPSTPTISISREFDAPPEKVFRAHTDPELVRQWLGPRRLRMTIDRWDCVSGGGYRYQHTDDEGTYGFYGSFHEVRENERIVQTFTFEGYPDGVSLETLTLTALDGGRCRLDILSVVDTFEARDMMLASGMETGINEGYEQLDELLAR